VLRATHPSPTSRTGDVPTALVLLADAERDAAGDGDGADPLEAAPETVLDGRFRLIRRLGQGSTAVGLLIHDQLADDPDADCVLKVALDEDAAARLDDEAEALRRLDCPHVVKLLEDHPLVVGGRRALLLENAGPETLTDVLRTRTRLSLDLLERFGTDLLDGLVALDKAGIDHRDIKPSNLGVRLRRGGDRTKHLVLFDFSLTRAAASATQAGTPPYLDPFLVGARARYDSAAERYAASVVLFEMATGHTPVHGDGQADPATVPDEATIAPPMFDPTLADAFVEFFRTALARNAADRHHTATELRSAWLAVFARDATTRPDSSNDELAALATLVTPLADSGLTARALSALEPYAVQTVGELLTVDPVRLARLPGVANATRLQISARIKQWRERLGHLVPSDRGTGLVPTPVDAADLLVRTVATSRSPSRGGLVRLVLGPGTSLEAFATHADLGAALDPPVTTGRATQLLGKVQELWAADDDARALLDRLADAVTVRLNELGTVATVAELTATVLETLAPQEHPDEHPDERLARGLLRFALERRRAMNRADGSQRPVWVRRRGGVVTLLAQEQALFDVAESLGAEADRIVAEAGEATEAVVPMSRVLPRLEAAVPAGADLPAELAQPARRVALAAAVSTAAAASGAGELHHRDLAPVVALELTFAGFGGQQLAPEEIRERVRVRFPAVPQLPQRPALDALVTAAKLELRFDDRLRVYRPDQPGTVTTGLESRQPTSHVLAASPVGSTGALGDRLEQSVDAQSFLALGARADRLPRFVRAARSHYGATVVDLTAVLIETLKAAATAAGLPWDVVLAADAEAETSRGRRGLHVLLGRSWPAVQAAIEASLSGGNDTAPVLLTDAAPLARYDNLGLLARWTDLAAPPCRLAPGAATRRQLRPPARRPPRPPGRPEPVRPPGQRLDRRYRHRGGRACGRALTSWRRNRLSVKPGNGSAPVAFNSQPPVPGPDQRSPAHRLSRCNTASSGTRRPSGRHGRSRGDRPALGRGVGRLPGLTLLDVRAVERIFV
jgi:serine/threonine protein kinase